MFRLLVGPAIIGILAFSIVYFIIPLMFSESDTVAVFAQFTLDSSNSIFATMPSLLADYLARLNLLLVALTIALLLVIATQLLLIIGDMLMLAATAIASIFRRKPRKTGPVDLPPLDLDASNRVSRPGSKILGGGFDSLDRD